MHEKVKMTISIAKHLIPEKTKGITTHQCAAKLHIQFYLLRMHRSSLYRPFYPEWQSVVEGHMSKMSKSRSSQKIIVSENSFDWDSGFSDG